MKDPEANAIQLATVFNHLTNGILLMDTQGYIIEANQSFFQQFALPKQELKKVDLRTFMKKSSKNAFEIFLSHHSEKNEYASQEFDIINGKDQVHQIKLSFIKENAPRPAFILGALTNKSNYSFLKKELKKQEELKKNRVDKPEEESELSEMKSRFLSIASHEFRTPLAGILSSLNLMSRYLSASESDFASLNNKAKIEKHIDKISESVKNLTTILNKFLALGNIEKGEIPIKYSRFDIKKTLESQTSLFQQICKPGQQINYSHKGAIRMVFLDVYLLKNILNNLLSNAVKFSPENTDIQLTSIVDKNEIQLIVSDEGIGIPAAEQKFIFRRFYRAKNALSLQDGTGLGLNIVVKYVELMEGNVAVESNENVGTTFRITFKNVKK